MQFFVDGAARELIPIKTFRLEYELNENFSVALFEPKDFTGLAAIDRAGTELNQLRQGLLDLLPSKIAKRDLLSVADAQTAAFRAGLYGINEKIGLKPEEAEFAVAGFGDVLQNWAYALIQGQSEFKPVYFQWLNNSIRVSQDSHNYEHQGRNWKINILNHAYGRMGLRVQIGENFHYLLDAVYACPAEGYMLNLLTEISNQLLSNSAFSEK